MNTHPTTNASRARALLVCIALISAICAGCRIGWHSAAAEERETARTEVSVLSNADARSEEAAFEEEAPKTQTAPDFYNGYCEAIKAYREYLLNRRTIDSHPFYGQFIRVLPSEFTLIDMDDDGIPELHIQGILKRYSVFSFTDGKLRWFIDMERSGETALLHNRALYTQPWPWDGVKNSFQYIDRNGHSFKVFGDKMYGGEEISWSYIINGEGHGKDASEEEIDKMSEPYREFAKNSDMIPWTGHPEFFQSNKDEFIYLARDNLGQVFPITWGR
jgi:hypothetical protein